jgi:hypothetical protein
MKKYSSSAFCLVHVPAFMVGVAILLFGIFDIILGNVELK